MSSKEDERIEAAKRGDKTYAGEACSVCGTVRRYTLTAKCAACMRAKSTAQYRKRTEAVRALLQKARAE